MSVRLFTRVWFPAMRHNLHRQLTAVLLVGAGAVPEVPRGSQVAVEPAAGSGPTPAHKEPGGSAGRCCGTGKPCGGPGPASRPSHSRRSTALTMARRTLTSRSTGSCALKSRCSQVTPGGGPGPSCPAAPGKSGMSVKVGRRDEVDLPPPELDALGWRCRRGRRRRSWRRRGGRHPDRFHVARARREHKEPLAWRLRGEDGGPVPMTPPQFQTVLKSQPESACLGGGTLPPDGGEGPARPRRGL